MTPLIIEQKESIATRLAFIETELSDLEKLKQTSWLTYQNSREIRRNIERICENLANACIDIGKIILAGESIEMPESYRDVIRKLGAAEIISQKLAEDLSDLVIIRNILAHQYLDLKWDKIKIFLEKGPQVIEEFAKTAQKIIS